MANSMSPALALEAANTTLSPCEECQKQPAIYACPRCRRRTCSLACCRSHKQRTKCNGKRDLTAFQPLSQMNDSTIQSDYLFLESVLGTLESGRKLIQQHGGASASTRRDSGHAGTANQPTSSNDNHPHKRPRVDAPSSSLPSLPPGLVPASLPQQSSMTAKQRHFVQQASQRGVTVLLQPSMMQRSQFNKSYATRQGDLFWTVEWRIHSSNNDEAPQTLRTLVKDKVMMDDALRQCLNAHKLDMDMTAHHLLLKCIPCPANQSLYSELSRQFSLSTCLQDRTVVEFPTIEIVPHDRLAQFPLLVQDEL